MKPIAILRPTEEESPGTLAEVLVEAGRTVCSVDLFRSDIALQLDDWSGLVVLGGTMSVCETERYPFLRDAIETIRSAVERDLPVLGICLGSQLVAAALGGEVRENRTKEVGWYDLEVNDNGMEDPLLAPWGPTSTVFQWHGDTFTLPVGALHLARTEDCQQQAFRYGRAVYGVQFHPEVTRAIIERWVDEPKGRAEIAALEGGSATEILAQLTGSLPTMQQRAAEMFRLFARLCGEPVADIRRTRVA